MSKTTKLEMKLPPADDLFSTEEQRQEAKLPSIYNIPLAEIDDFPDHPYRVKDDEDMTMLEESIKEHGVITPTTVRKKEDGRYEMISGHRRKYACEKLGMETLRCEIVDVSRDEAIIMMVDSNAQRSEIAPTDKGRAYKMKLEAMKRLPGRPSKENCDPVGHNFKLQRSVEELAENADDSKTQIQRYIRLTELVPELQEYVDNGQIKMRPAVEMSYLDEEAQRSIVDRIDELEVFPSHDQTIRMRKAFEEGALTFELVSEIMAEEKPNQKQTFKIPSEKVKEITRRDFTPKDFESFWVDALVFYQKHLDRVKANREAR